MGVNLHQPVAVAFEENRDMIVDDPDEQDTVFDGEENSGNVINSVRGQLLDGDEPGRWVTHLDFLDKQSMLVDHSPILHRMVVDNDTALDPMVIDDNAAQHDMVTEDQPGQQDPPPNTKSLRQRPWKPLPSAKSIGKRKAPHASCIRESKRSKPDEAALAQHAETTNLDRSLDLIGLNELFVSLRSLLPLPSRS
jgi:hypothetical protein